MESNKICVSTTPEEMWQELQAEKKHRNAGFDLNNLPESNVSMHASEICMLNFPCSFYERIMAKGLYLLEPELLEALHHPRARQILDAHLSICKKLQYEKGLYPRVQRKIALYDWGREVLYEYLKKRYYWSLDSVALSTLEAQQQNFFKSANLQEILYRHCANGWILFDETKKRILKLPYASEILLLYLKTTKDYFSESTLLEICKRPYAHSFFEKYIELNHYMSDEVKKKIKYLT